VLAAQTFPQVPQLLLPVCSLTQAPEQLVCPAWQLSTQAPPNWQDSGLGLIPPQGSSSTGTFIQTNASARFYRVQAVLPLAH